MKTEESTETKTARRLPGGKAVWQKDPRVAGDKLAYSVKEAADALGVSAWYIRDEMNQGHLAYSCPRGRQLIPRWELVRYLESTMRPAAQPAEDSAVQAAASLNAARPRLVMA